MDINQIYRAPSISKLSKRNISSSLIRGASNISSISSAPKLKSSSFSFKSKSDEQKAQILSSTSVNGNNEEKNNILSETLKFQSETLSETNRILVEIQKQLSLDFAMRIAEEKEIVKKIKATESKKRFSEKEASVEGLKRGGGAIKTIFDKLITTPAKNILDKIKEFFSLILTGIVYNAAFKWLQDKNNRKLLDQIFDWIGKAFIPAVIAIVGYKVFKWIRRLVLLGRWLWKLPGRLSQAIKNILPPKGGGATPQGPKRPSPPPNQRPPTRSPLTQGRGYGPTPRPSPTQPLITPSGSPLVTDPLSPYKGAGSTPGQAPGVPAKPVIPPQSKFASILGNFKKFFAPIGKIFRALGLFLLFDELKSDLENGDAKAIAVKLSAYGLGWLTTFLMAGGGTAASATGVGAAPGVPMIIGSVLAGAAVDQGIRSMFGYGMFQDQNGKKDGGTIKASNGMTVPGKGPGNVDSVKANLAPGEEVIRTQSAMQFRPLLKDINDNAGRLWVTFTQAITKLFSVSAYQNEVSSEFSKVIKDFDKYLKDEITKNKNKKPNTPSGGPSGVGSYQKTNPSISPSPKVTNINMISQQSGGGMTFLPMNLPPIRSKPPEISMPKDKATDVPVISSVNMANPYMQLTPEIYGIFV